MTSSPVSNHKTQSGVAVLIATYNRAAYLREALQSILAQTQAPAQIVVIDDGSTDDTREVVEGFGSAVEYRHKVNGGKASALNLGLSRVVQPLIWIFDDDDIAEPQALETMTRVLMENPQCGFVYGRLDIFDDEKGVDPSAELVEMPEFPPERLFIELTQRFFIWQGAMLARRSCYDSVGGFNEGLIRSQDYEMLLRLASRFTAVKIEVLLFHQRHHTGVRGTAAAPIEAKDIRRGWREADKLIFTALRRELPLVEYLTASERELCDPASARRLALLRRFVACARKDLWAEAVEDFEAFVEATAAHPRANLTAVEAELLERTFDIFGQALLSFGDQERFRRVFRSIRPRTLRADIAAAFLTSLTYPSRAALKSGSLVDIKTAAGACIGFVDALALGAYIQRMFRKKVLKRVVPASPVSGLRTRRS